MKSKVNMALYFFFAFLILIYAAVNPSKNSWDTIAYVASARAIDSPDAETYHRYAYELLRKYVPPDVYADLTDPSYQYRANMYDNAALFSQQMSFYKIRILYIYGIWLLQKAGVNAYNASHAISVFSVGAAFLILGLFAIRLRINLVTSFLPMLLIPLGVILVARTGTPDGLTFFGVCIVFYFYYLRRLVQFLFFLPVLVLIRTDLILLIACFSTLFFLIERKYCKGYLISAGISVVVYLAINYRFGNHGWSTLFYFTFIKHISELDNVHYIVKMSDYARVLKAGLINAYYTSSFLIYLFLTFIIFVRQIANNKFVSVFMNNKLIQLHYVGGVYVFFHFVLFPVVWERFFIAEYAITLVACLNICQKEEL